jgi:hypothetical protein
MESQAAEPRALQNRPELFPDLRSVWESFWFLHSARPVGMSVGAIPLADIVTYWRTLECVIDDDDFQAKVRLVRELDSEYLRWQRKQEETKDGARNNRT